MQPGVPKRRDATAGFSRIELLTLLLSLFALALVARPVWGEGSASRRLLCLENFRRLASAWLLYADDNSGKFVGSYHGAAMPSPTATVRPWASGWLDWTTSPDNTNATYLVTPRYAGLAVYLNADVTLFKCPADDFLSPPQRLHSWVARVRSYSMNIGMGAGNAESGPWGSSLLHVTGISDFGRNTPQRLFVFVEEHPDSINDAAFFAPISPSAVFDLPAAQHEGGCWFSFADGHAERRLWQTPGFKRSVSYGYPGGQIVGTGNPDVQWLLDHTPHR